MVILTDGKDQANSVTYTDAISKKEDNTIYVLHVNTDDADRNISKSLASDENIYDINDFNQGLESALINLNEYLEEFANSFYYLQYASPKRAGTHKVSAIVGDNVMFGTFDANNFSSVTAELQINNIAKNQHFDINSSYLVNADILWTSQSNKDVETFLWTSSDDSILKITNKDDINASIKFITDDNVTLTLAASLHNLSKTITFNDDLKLIGDYNTIGNAHDVDIVGNYAYIADYNSGLQILDISEPSKPTFVGSYNTNGQSYSIDVLGDYAYIADGNYGLQIIDISTPSEPTFVSKIFTGHYAFDVKVVGDYAYVVDNANGLKIIDISTPATPTIIGSYDTNGYAYGIDIVGDYAYIADNHGGLKIIDISTPSTPTLIRNYTYTSSEAKAVDVLGDYAYIADDKYGLRIVDISNPATASFVASYKNPAFIFDAHASDIKVVGNYAYMTITSGILEVIDISNPALPILVESYNTNTGATSSSAQSRGLDVIGNYAYVADDNPGLKIIDISRKISIANIE